MTWAMNFRTAPDRLAYQRAYTKQREAEGFRQISMWVDGDAVETLDELQKAGGFKNRGEVVAELVKRARVQELVSTAQQEKEEAAKRA